MSLNLCEQRRAERAARGEEADAYKVTRPDASSDAGGDTVANDGDGASPKDAAVGPGVCPTGLPGPTMVAMSSAGGGAFCIDATEVTNADYATFLATNPVAAAQTGACATNTSFEPPFNWPASDPTRPVVNVDWCDATSYCAWAGKELCGAPGKTGATAHDDPTAATSLWFSACSAAGASAYPYGASYEPTACNGLDYAAGATLDVDQPVSCRGPISALLDMSGNVWEWENACEGDAASDPCLVRGGSFRSDEFSLTCSASTLVGRDTRFDDFGFRCCAE